MGYHKALPGIGWVSLIPFGATNPSPVEVARITSLSLEVKDDDAPLEDENGDEIDSFRKAQKVSGKFSVNEFSSVLFAAAVGGATIAAGSKVGATHSAPIPTTPFQITVTQGATFDKNLAVVDLTAGKRMTRVASAPATGQYAVNETTGVYTFATADQGHTVFIRYRYTAAAAGYTTTLGAGTPAAAQKYEIYYQSNQAGVNSGFLVPYARIPGLSASFKRDGWSETSVDFNALVHPTLNQKLIPYTPE